MDCGCQIGIFPSFCIFFFSIFNTSEFRHVLCGKLHFMHGQRRLHFLITYKSKWQVIPGTFLNVYSSFYAFFLGNDENILHTLHSGKDGGGWKSEVLMSPRGLLHYHRPSTRFKNILSILLWYGLRQPQPHWQQHVKTLVCTCHTGGACREKGGENEFATFFLPMNSS